MHLKPGSTLLNGKFRIVKVLGQGGFGITYLAEHTLLGNYVAIKEFFPSEYCDRDEATSHITLGTQRNAEFIAKLQSRFIKEAQNIAKLKHKGIVKIHDIFEENNTAYYVMDFIEGGNLHDIIAKNGPLSEVEAINLILKIGDAISYLHRNKMTHFDLKPANILVSAQDNEPILIDFGLSKQFDAKGKATSTVLQGVSHGFSAMELYVMGNVVDFSPETDVYSFVATLYYLLTGKIPPNAIELMDNGASVLEFPLYVSTKTKSIICETLSALRKDREKDINQIVHALSSSGANNSNPPVPPTYIPPKPPHIQSHNEHIESPKSVETEIGVPPVIPPAEPPISQQISDSEETPLSQSVSQPITPIPPTVENTRKKDSKSGCLIAGIVFGIVIILIAAVVGALIWFFNSHNDYAYEDEDTSVVEEVYVDDSPDTCFEAVEESDFIYRTGGFTHLNENYVVYIDGKECFFFTGDFTYEGVDYPMMLCVIYDGNANFHAVYKNVDYDTKIVMDADSYGIDNMRFNGKDGYNDFIIDIDYNYDTNSWSGTAWDGDQSMYIYLTPTLETFTM